MWPLISSYEENKKKAAKIRGGPKEEGNAPDISPLLPACAFAHLTGGRSVGRGKKGV